MAVAAGDNLGAKKSGKCRPPKTSANSYRAAAAAVGVPPPVSSLFDMHTFSAVHHLQHHHQQHHLHHPHHHNPHHLPYQVILASLGANTGGGNGGGGNNVGHLNQPRRRSVPQDVFIRSLTNYTA